MVSMVSISEILNFVEDRVKEKTGRSLSDLQRIIFQESWQDTKITYDQIAKENNYSNRYVKQIAGPTLWQLFSQVFGQKVTKLNVRAVIEAEFQSCRASDLSNKSQRKTSNLPIQTTQQPLDSAALATQPLQALESPLRLGSEFYVERFPNERQLCLNMLQSGALIRIKGMKGMGKSSFLLRFLQVAQSHLYRTVTLNLKVVDQNVLGDLTKLTRWTAANLSYQLDIPPNLDLIWDEDIGDKLSCTLYLESYLCKKLESPLVIVWEELNEIFQYEHVAHEFLTMLRVWHENTRSNQKWEKIHIIIVQATELYVPLNINQSPFTVGHELNLLPLNEEQFGALAAAHQSTLSQDELKHLRLYVNGHPRLLQLAFYHLAQAEFNDKQTLDSFLSQASTDAGIFHQHLHQYLWALQNNQSLGLAFQDVLRSENEIEIPQAEAFKLSRMGLVNIIDNDVRISCPLYQDYFSRRLKLPA